MDYSGIISSVITAAATLTGLFIEKKLSERKTKKNGKDLNQKTINEMVSPILSSIMNETNCLRVDYWEAENGAKTLSGYSLLKITMFEEILGYRSDGAKVESMIKDSRKIPIENFERNMRLMRAEKNNRFFISYELEKEDELANWYKSYEVDTLVVLKTYTKGDWTGMITISYEGKKGMSSEEVSWLKTQASRADNLVTAN